MKPRKPILTDSMTQRHEEIIMPRLMRANTIGELHDHIHYERESCSSEPACKPLDSDYPPSHEGDPPERYTPGGAA